MPRRSASTVKGLTRVWEQASREAVLPVLRLLQHPLGRSTDLWRDQHLALGRERVAHKEAVKEGARRRLAAHAERGVPRKGPGNPDLSPVTSSDHPSQRAPLMGRQLLS
eukprot:9477993-Pyramimonas_sp.AAC.1